MGHKRLRDELFSSFRRQWQGDPLCGGRLAGRESCREYKREIGVRVGVLSLLSGLHGIQSKAFQIPPHHNHFLGCGGRGRCWPASAGAPRREDVAALLRQRAGG